MKIASLSSKPGGTGMPLPSPISGHVRQSHCSALGLRTISNVGPLLPGMQRFNIGDPVLVLPRFAHLFPTNTGVVTSVSADPFRPMFNEYALKLDDGTPASVFE